MPKTRLVATFNDNQKEFKRQLVHGPSPRKKAQRGLDPVQADYAMEPPSPWWLRGVLTSAPINKLMIIAKWKATAHNIQQQKVA